VNRVPVSLARHLALLAQGATEEAAEALTAASQAMAGGTGHAVDVRGYTVASRGVLAAATLGQLRAAWPHLNGAQRPAVALAAQVLSGAAGGKEGNVAGHGSEAQAELAA
jgi:hypothetical protein